MIRRVQLNINYANTNKLNSLDRLFNESIRVINEFIDIFWSAKDFKSKFSTEKVDTFLSARMQQCLGKQALEIVKSQRRKKNKTKPEFTKSVINLDSRFLDIRTDSSGEFDIWIKLSSIGDNIKLCLPSKKHKHFNKFSLSDWTIKKSTRLRRNDNGYFIDVYFEKNEPEKKTSGASIGLDCGYKKLLIDSNGITYDNGLEKTYTKISNKQQGSKNFKQSLVERDNKINETINAIDLSNVSTIVVEDLKNVKKDSHKNKRIRKSFMNKLQRWSYPKVLSKLSNLCDELGITLIRVDPSYTSQTCSVCGHVDKSNRSGERFNCQCCRMSMDADHNAAINILHRGVYSLSTV